MAVQLPLLVLTVVSSLTSQLYAYNTERKEKSAVLYRDGPDIQLMPPPPELIPAPQPPELIPAPLPPELIPAPPPPGLPNDGPPPGRNERPPPPGQPNDGPPPPGQPNDGPPPPGQPNDGPPPPGQPKDGPPSPPGLPNNGSSPPGRPSDGPPGLKEGPPPPGGPNDRPPPGPKEGPPPPVRPSDGPTGLKEGPPPPGGPNDGPPPGPNEGPPPPGRPSDGPPGPNEGPSPPGRPNEGPPPPGRPNEGPPPPYRPNEGPPGLNEGPSPLGRINDGQPPPPGQPNNGSSPPGRPNEGPQLLSLWNNGSSPSGPKNEGALSPGYLNSGNASSNKERPPPGPPNAGPPPPGPPNAGPPPPGQLNVGPPPSGPPLPGEPLFLPQGTGLFGSNITLSEGQPNPPPPDQNKFPDGLRNGMLSNVSAESLSKKNASVLDSFSDFDPNKPGIGPRGPIPGEDQYGAESNLPPPDGGYGYDPSSTNVSEGVGAGMSAEEKASTDNLNIGDVGEENTITPPQGSTPAPLDQGSVAGNESSKNDSKVRDKNEVDTLVKIEMNFTLMLTTTKKPSEIVNPFADVTTPIPLTTINKVRYDNLLNLLILPKDKDAALPTTKAPRN